MKHKDGALASEHTQKNRTKCSSVRAQPTHSLFLVCIFIPSPTCNIDLNDGCMSPWVKCFFWVLCVVWVIAAWSPECLFCLLVVLRCANHVHFVDTGYPCKNAPFPKGCPSGVEEYCPDVENVVGQSSLYSKSNVKLHHPPEFYPKQWRLRNCQVKSTLFIKHILKQMFTSCTES